MVVRQAESRKDLEAVTALTRAFAAWRYQRHATDREMLDSYFDPEDFGKELRNLPGEFAPPEGALLVAEQSGRVAGCVALKPLQGGACEMKRMFVLPDCHGKGLGLKPGRAIVDAARRIGNRKTTLDTGPAQRKAQGAAPQARFQQGRAVSGHAAKAARVAGIHGAEAEALSTRFGPGATAPRCEERCQRPVASACPVTDRGWYRRAPAAGSVPRERRRSARRCPGRR